MLMLGDSTTTKLLDEVCELFGANAHSFIDVPEGTDRAKYHHKLRSKDHHACHLLPGGGLTLGGFAHYGATGPPYWNFAYPLAPWLARTTLGQVRQDMSPMPGLHKSAIWVGLALFLSAVPLPTDAAAASATQTQVPKRSSRGGSDSCGCHVRVLGHLRVVEVRRQLQPPVPGGPVGNGRLRASGCRDDQSRSRRVPKQVRLAWGRALKTYVRLAHPHRLAVARSRVVWRTLHPGFKHSITNGVTHMLNSAIKAHARLMGPLEILDVGEMLESLTFSAQVPPARIEKQALQTFGIPTSAYGTYDGRHLYPPLDVEVFNLILNLLWETAAPAGILGGPSTPAKSRLPKIKGTPKKLAKG